MDIGKEYMAVGTVTLLVSLSWTEGRVALFALHDAHSLTCICPQGTIVSFSSARSRWLNFKESLQSSVGCSAVLHRIKE
jgi:hypothetical protein